MDRESFFEWLDTCPSDKWEVIRDEVGYICVAFSDIWEYEEDPEQDAANA